MARNAIESDFRSSKMAVGGHFVINFQKKIKLRIDLKWREMRLKVIFGHPKPKMAAIGHFVKNFQKKESCESDFRSSKMAAVVNKIPKK